MSSFIKPEDILSEEHERQIALFRGVPYVQGQRLRTLAWVRFKQWHHKKLQEKDASELASANKQMELDLIDGEYLKKKQTKKERKFRKPDLKNVIFLNVNNSKSLK